MLGNEGFSLYNLDNIKMPVLVSVPHAGRFYPDAVFQNLRLPPDTLVRLEDRYADLLARGAIAAQVPVISANIARAWIDLNRDENDLDADMVEDIDREGRPAPGAKQRGGLGLIPRRLAGVGDLWRGRLMMDDVTQRIEAYHQPYHAQISQILTQMQCIYGVAILLDLHSMPPVPTLSSEKAHDFVIGDQFGRSATSRFSEYIIEQIRGQGFVAKLNNPYAGDYILRAHGNTRCNIHAIQLEVDRTLYLDAKLREPNGNVNMVSDLIARLVIGLAGEALGSRDLLAAE
jgi:N-formylglutamate amidohydrolase